NDGNLDIVVNNIDDPVIVYENKTNDRQNQSYCQVRLKGPPQNRNAVGAKVILFSGKEVMTYEKFPVHGFLSSMEVPLQIGLGNRNVDSAFLIWPDNSFQRLEFKKGMAGQRTYSYQKNLPLFNYTIL